MEKKDRLKLANWWPPFLGAGIRLKNIAADMRSMDTELRMHWWNKNYVGTHYSASMYSMIEPFYMLMLLENLGKDYVIWDKKTTIEFQKPAKGTLTAHFNLTQEQIDDIRHKADTQYKYEPEFTVQIKDEAGDVVAEAHKILYVKRRDHGPEWTPPTAV